MIEIILVYYFDADLSGTWQNAFYRENGHDEG